MTERSAKKGSKKARPVWLEDVQKTGATALVSVRRRDGSRAGFRMPSTSLLDAAAEQDRKVTQSH
jgi:hypothetical protein